MFCHLCYCSLLVAVFVGNFDSICQAKEQESGAASPSSASHSHDGSDDVQVLFEGESLEGWSGDPRLWSVRDGVIHGETTKDAVANGNTFLIWEGGELEDFELRLSFRCNDVNNSGIQYRSKHITDESARNDWVVRGYQHEVRNEEKFPNIAGFIYDEGGRNGRLCLVGEKATRTADGKKIVDAEELIDEEKYAELFNLDDWNEVRIVARGNHIQHYLNGRLILDYTDEHPELALSKGVIALQLHAGAPMWAEFKGIELKTFE